MVWSMKEVPGCLLVAVLLSPLAACSSSSNQSTSKKNPAEASDAPKNLPMESTPRTTNTATNANGKIKALAENAKTYYVSPENEAKVVTRPKCCNGKKCKPGQNTEGSDTWKDSEEWKALDFAMQDPHEYSNTGANSGDGGVNCDDGTAQGEDSDEGATTK